MFNVYQTTTVWLETIIRDLISTLVTTHPKRLLDNFNNN